MSLCTDLCDEIYDNCIKSCQKDPVPDIFDFLPKKVYLASVCYPKCNAKYGACLAACAAEAAGEVAEDIAEFVVDIVAAAAQFVRDHPGLVVGTVVIIAGVILIATTGPAGAVVLVAV